MIKISKFKEKTAENLLRIEAVFLRPEEPFIWASGIKSPVYCDNRLILTSPEIRKEVEFSIAKVIKEDFSDAEVLMGTATAGIPHAAIVAHIMNLPMGYVRTGAKTHGRTNRIEGRLEKGQKVVVIEDLISTGGSSVDTVEALRELGTDVLGIVSIMTYSMKKGTNRMREAEVKCVSLTDFDTVAEIAAKQGYIKEKDIDKLMKFRDNPSDESWIKK